MRRVIQGISLSLLALQLGDCSGDGVGTAEDSAAWEITTAEGLVSGLESSTGIHEEVIVRATLEAGGSVHLRRFTHREQPGEIKVWSTLVSDCGPWISTGFQINANFSGQSAAELAILAPAGRSELSISYYSTKPCYFVAYPNWAKE